MFPEPEATGGGEGAPEVEAEVTPEAETEKNPFDSISFDDTEETEQTDETQDEEKESEAFTLTFEEGLDLDDSEKVFFEEAAQECGLTSEVASRVFSSLVRKVNENNARIAKERDAEAMTALRKAWGKSFNANAKQAAQLIKAVGARRGWTAEQMNAFKNPHDMAMFYDIAMATSGRLSLGVTNAAPAKAPMTKEQAATEINSTIAEYWSAQARNDTKEMRRLSDKHMELLALQTGKKGVRLLAIP